MDVAGFFGAVALVKDGSELRTNDAASTLVEQLRASGFSATKGEWPADWRRYRGVLDGPDTRTDGASYLDRHRQQGLRRPPRASPLGRGQLRPPPAAHSFPDSGCGSGCYLQDFYHGHPVLLSRLQFAWVIGWHILLPAFTVGMASYIAILEGLHAVTGRDVYLRISTFWIRISRWLSASAW